jgi:hypothetical protein
MLVISCHADTGFREHRLERLAGGVLHGHLDNFAGVHAVMLAYFSGRLPAQGVRIELTYGEETDFAGAYEVLHTLRADDVVLVVDVTGTPTDKGVVVEKCADPRLRELVERALAGMPYDLYADCPDPVESVDETDVYREACRQTCFVGVPVSGGDYNAGPVSCKEGSIQAVAEALCRIAGTWAAGQARTRQEEIRP